MKKILIHTQYYPPEIGAPQARLSDLAIGLEAKGFSVTVLTAMPNYPKGKIYPGYRALLRRETFDGISIIRTWIYPTQKLSLFPRLLSYFSFVISSFLIGIWFIGKMDFVITESPPLFLAISSFLLCKIKRAKWIFNVSDLWPESAQRLGAIKDGAFLKLAGHLESFCYQHAWLVTGQSESIIENIHQRFPDLHLYHLSNGVDIDLFTPRQPKAIYKGFSTHDSELIVFYGGLHGLAQGLDQILYAAKNISSNVRFILMGDGPEKEKLIKIANELQLTNLAFHDPVSKSEMPNIIASVDICLVPLKAYLPGAVPSKLYEAMAAAKPVILIAEGEAKDIVDRYQAGLVVTPGDLEGLVNAINQLASSKNTRTIMGENGRNAATQHYSRQQIIENFSNMLLDTKNTHA